MKLNIIIFTFICLTLNNERLDDDLDTLIATNSKIAKPKVFHSSRKFDLKAFLEEMDEFECDSDRSASSIHRETFNELCDDKLEDSALSEIGNFRESGNNLFDYLNENVYLPLAFRIPKKGSISEQLLDLVHLNDNHQALPLTSEGDSFDSFEN